MNDQIRYPRVIGFTGTQKGMTPEQKAAVNSFISKATNQYSCVVHHGDCIGADSDCHDICLNYYVSFVIHPPVDPTKRAFKDKGVIELRKAFKYLTRNKHIVNECQILIACPHENNEVLRSGTWSTIRYAQKSKNCSILIIYPDGTTATTIFDLPVYSSYTK